MKYLGFLFPCTLVWCALMTSGCSSPLVRQGSGSSVKAPLVSNYSTGAAAGTSAAKLPQNLTAETFRQREAAVGSRADWPALSLAKDAMDQAKRTVGRDRKEAVGWYLAGIELCARIIAAAPEGTPAGAGKPSLRGEATDLYNYGLARIIDPMQQLGVPAIGDKLVIQGPGATYQLQLVRSDRWLGDYRATVAVPTDQMRITSLPHKLRYGVGAPMVLRAPALPPEVAREEFAARKGLWYGRTLVADFRPAGTSPHTRTVDFLILNAGRRETVSLGGRTVPLAGDFTAAMSVAVDESKIASRAIAGVFGAGKLLDRTGLFMFEPFDPNKIPVVLVHGLYSTPATWVPMLNQLAGNPEIRRRYQFWCFYYPTGLPIPYSAHLLRSEMDRADKKFGLSSKFKGKVVFIGHSMGGLLSQQQVVNPGNRLMNAALSARGLTTADIPADQADLLGKVLIYKSRPFDGRVIFIATPHLGADMASKWFARLASRFISMPFKALKTATTVVINTDSPEKKKETAARKKLRQQFPTGIDNLAPHQPYFVELNKLPLVVPFHNIIGHNGPKGGPGSTDGVVPYWSSYLAGAQSNLEVKSNHEAHITPEAIAEVTRILTLK